MEATKPMTVIEKDFNVINYSMVGNVGCYFNEIEDGRSPVVCFANDAIGWVEHVLQIVPQKDIYSNFTYYLTGAQLTALILRFVN